MTLNDFATTRGAEWRAYWTNRIAAYWALGTVNTLTAYWRE